MPLRGRAGDRDRSAERFGAVGEAEDAGAATGVDAADAIVADRDRQDTVIAPGAQLDDGCPGVLGDVGERLGGDVVRGRLDRRRQPLVESHVDVDVDREIGAACERSECRPEPGFGEDRGVDAARDLAQLLGDILQAARRAPRRCLAIPPAALRVIARARKLSAIRRCWIPSWRSRSIRRRASSAAATILRREAASSSELSAFAIAVATSSVNRSSRSSVPGSGGRSAFVDETPIMPHVLPSTVMGAATDDRRPNSSRPAGARDSHASHLPAVAGARLPNPAHCPQRRNRTCLSSDPQVPPVGGAGAPFPGAPAGRGRWSRWCAAAS